MEPTDGKKRPQVDWEAVEVQYRAGVRSLRDIAGEFGCTETAVRKRAKRDEWVRDLSAKIAAKADALVRKAEVRNEVRNETTISEREEIAVSAQLRAGAELLQRSDIKRARLVVQKLWDLVEVELDYPNEFAQIGEMLRAEDEFGNDKLNDLYRAAIGLPQQVKNAKALADALKVLIELERKVLKIDEQPAGDEGTGKVLNDAQRASRIAFLLSKAQEQ